MKKNGHKSFILERVCYNWKIHELYLIRNNINELVYKNDLIYEITNNIYFM